jgi:hypothetical protein
VRKRIETREGSTHAAETEFGKRLARHQPNIIMTFYMG